VGDLDPGLRQRVSKARVARLATVRPDRRPHIVPITFALEGDTIVTAIDQKPKTTRSLQRLRNLEAYPMASVLFDHYEDDWSSLWWARADGTASIVAEGDTRERAIERLTEKYPTYGKSPPEGPVIEISVERWTSWSP
jgi:PPOX class probable F420-dependent enzyme